MNIAQTTQTLVGTIYYLGVCACFLSQFASSGTCAEITPQHKLTRNQAFYTNIYNTESAFTKLDSDLTFDRIRHQNLRASVEGFVAYLIDNGSPLNAEENRNMNVSIEHLYKKTGRKVTI